MPELSQVRILIWPNLKHFNWTKNVKLSFQIMWSWRLFEIKLASEEIMNILCPYCSRKCISRFVHYLLRHVVMFIHYFALMSLVVFQHHYMWRLHRCFVTYLIFLKTTAAPNFLNAYRICVLVFVWKKATEPAFTHFPLNTM